MFDYYKISPIEATTPELFFDSLKLIESLQRQGETDRRRRYGFSTISGATGNGVLELSYLLALQCNPSSRM
jgi:hypothetical protein